jgi:medium-chain acyl-[acyl-carrier-protein] hydrolase
VLLVSGHRAPHLPDLHPPCHALPDAELQMELRHLDGTPPAVLGHAELMELFLPTLRADFELCETYEHVEEPPLPVPIHAFGGRNDAQVRPDELLAWARHTTADFQCRLLPGGHFYLHDAEAALLAELSAALTVRRVAQPSAGMHG